jgi:hypothetical protein
MRLIPPRLKSPSAVAPGSAPGSMPETVRAPLYKAQNYFTVPDGESKLLYSAEGWVKARLYLENAGPVVVGESQNITPVLSGKGMTLPTGEWCEWTLTKGSRIFIAAESVNRVKFNIAPVPFAEQLGAFFGSSLQTMRSMLAALTGRK